MGTCVPSYVHMHVIWTTDPAAPSGRPAAADRQSSEEGHVGKLDGKIALVTGGSRGIGVGTELFVDGGFVQV